MEMKGKLLFLGGLSAVLAVSMALVLIVVPMQTAIQGMNLPSVELSAASQAPAAPMAAMESQDMAVQEISGSQGLAEGDSTVTMQIKMQRVYANNPATTENQ